MAVEQIMLAIARLLPPFSWLVKRLGQGYPIEAAVEATARQMGLHGHAVRDTIHAWMNDPDVQAFIIEAKRSGVRPELSEQVVAAFVAHSEIDGLTPEAARRTILTFVDELQRAIADDEGLHGLENRLVERVEFMFSRVAASTNAERWRLAEPASAGSGEADEWHRRLNEGRALQIGGKHQAALEVYRQIAKDLEGVEVEARVRYRLNLNVGSALIQLQQLDEGEEYTRRALDYIAGDCLALTNLAQIEIMRSQWDRAHAFAQEAVKADETNESAWVALLQSTPISEPSPEPPADLLERAMIQLALGVRAGRAGHVLEARDRFKAALEVGERDPQTLVLLGEVIQAAKGTAHETGQEDEDTYRLATEAVDGLENTDFPALEVRARMLRVASGIGLGRDVVEDLRRATHLSDDESVQESVARAYYFLGDLSRAEFILDELPGGEAEPPSRRAIRVRVAAARDDREGVADLLDGIEFGSMPPEERLDIAESCIALEATALAARALADLQAPQGLEAVAQTMRGRLAVLRGDEEAAREAYLAAIAVAEDEVGEDVTAEYGQALARLELHHEVAAVLMPLWSRVVRSDRLAEVLARSLYHLEMWEDLDHLLQTLGREGRLTDWSLDAAAVVALNRDDLPTAIEHLEELLRLRPEDAEARIRLGAALLRSGQPQAAFEYIEPLDPADLSAVDAIRIAEIRQLAGEKDRFLEFAKRAIRLAPDDAEIQRAFIATCVRWGDAETAPDVAGVDTEIVLVAEDTDETVSYRIVSDEPQRGPITEIDEQDEVAALLTGASVGDPIVFLEGQPGERRYRVTELKPLVTSLFQEVMSHFGTRHPTDGRIQAFDVGEPGSPAFMAPVLAALHSQRAGRQSAFRLYEESHIPIGFLASLLGHSLWKVVGGLLSAPERRMWTEFGDPEGRARSRAAAASDRPVVVTISALRVLEDIGCLEALAATGRPLRFPRSLLFELRTELEEVQRDIAGGGRSIMAGDEAGMMLVEISAEELEVELHSLQQIVDFLGTRAEAVPRPLEALAADNRKLAEALGQSSSDAYLLAGAEADLYADDLGLRGLAYGRGGQSFSTDAFFAAQLAQQRITWEEYASVAVRLLRMGHEHVSVSADLVYEVLRAEGFETTPNTIAVLDNLAVGRASTDSAVPVAAGTVRRLATSPLGGGHIRGIVLLLAERLTRGAPDLGALDQFEDALRLALRLLPLDFAEARRAIKDFRASRGGDAL